MPNTNELSKFTTDELLDELRSREDVWAIKAWLRADVERWLGDNLENYDNAEHDLEDRQEEIIKDALGGTACLDESCEADWASIEYYMDELLKNDFGAFHNIAN